MKLLNRLGAWLYNAWPHFDITKEVPCTEKDGISDTITTLYLRRFFLWEWRKVCSGFVHNILRPDEDRDPHDHPRSFVTIVLRGGYTDERWLPEYRASETFGTVRAVYKLNEPWGPGQMEQCEPDVLRAGSIRFRPAEHIHRVREVLPNTWTLTLWGPYRREWGFWKKESAQWVQWREYLGISKDEEYDGD